MKHHHYLPNLWGAIFIIIILFSLEFLIGAAFYDAGIVYFYGDPRSSVISVLANGILFSVLMHLSGLTYRELFHPSQSSVASTVLLLAGPILLVVLGSLWWLTDLTYFIASFFPKDKMSLAMLQRLLSSGVISMLAIVVIGPFLEEMLFRGIILRGFLTHYSKTNAILLSALLFAVVHLNIYQIPTAFIIGCFLGWLFYASKSLWPCIFAHAANNAADYVFYELKIRAALHTLLLDGVMLLLSGLGIYLLYKILGASKRSASGGGVG